LAGLLLVHVALWTFFGSVTHPVVHHDMAEAWAWGKEFEFGYSKHPPLFPWVAGLWFSFMPRENWSFFLLSSINSALGLAGAWMVAGRLLPRSSQWAALLLLCLTPFYGLLALKFNANTVLLPLWPWAAYVFIRAIETRSGIYGALFGALAGLALLGKYYSVLLLASCFIAAVLHPSARAIFRSPAPWAAGAACSLVIAPHLLWVIENSFPTVDYALAKTRYPVVDVLARGGVAALVAVAFHLPLLGLLLVALPGFRRRFAARVWTRARAGCNRWLVALGTGPLALTLVACAVGNVRISDQFMIPIFFLVPTLLLVLSGLRMSEGRLRPIIVAVLATSAALAAAAVPIARLEAALKTEPWREPTRAVALDATRLWHRIFGRKLEIVSGETMYAQAATFYSSDAPSIFTDFDARQAPWITPDRMMRSGMLVMCRVESTRCLDKAAQHASVNSVHVERTYRARSGAVRRFALIFIPPAGAKPASPLDD
jgi:4-amino-4-deoxy-L-arabinose transferase-like glycosyltransferase